VENHAWKSPGLRQISEAEKIRDGQEDYWTMSALRVSGRPSRFSQTRCPALEGTGLGGQAKSGPLTLGESRDLRI